MKGPPKAVWPNKGSIYVDSPVVAPQKIYLKQKTNNEHWAYSKSFYTSFTRLSQSECTADSSKHYNACYSLMSAREGGELELWGNEKEPIHDIWRQRLKTCGMRNSRVGPRWGDKSLLGHRTGTGTESFETGPVRWRRKSVVETGAEANDGVVGVGSFLQADIH